MKIERRFRIKEVVAKASKIGIHLGSYVLILIVSLILLYVESYIIVITIGNK